MGEILSQWGHFFGSDEWFWICVFNVCRLASHALHIVHWNFSRRSELYEFFVLTFVWTFCIWENKSFRELNGFEQNSQISVCIRWLEGGGCITGGITGGGGGGGCVWWIGFGIACGWQTYWKSNYSLNIKVLLPNCSAFYF